MATKFKIEKHSNIDKDFEILGHDDLRITIDNDDVDHDKVSLLSAKMVKILNDHWNSEKYNMLPEDEEFAKWLIKTFSESSEDMGNQESIEDVVIKRKGKTTEITFSANCGDYGIHTNNIVTITDKKVNVNLGGPLEGGDVEYDFQQRIERYLED